MSYLAWLVPVALGMGLVGLAAFLWTMRSGQYDDLDGAAERVLLEQRNDEPLLEQTFGNEHFAGGGSNAAEQRRQH